ncbi:hypothetical protein HNP73_003906 [Amaricoccus macauensis]|uniref:Peptidase inhibitor I78 family protein n=1 Tax=Amaricoccus macauensis TaxID=57001 RepID=A0A840STV3_9RHOB|nr:I78 family peptidase inhibitor [Amaricoccus macauensis]MBB5223945.1 hypothetical protein [Amaricoccus macauensis]
MGGRWLLPAGLLVVGLTGCNTGVTDTEAIAGAGADTCGADQLQALVGQDASAANGAVFTGEFRVLAAGEAGGAMFKPQRTTVRLDEQNRILRVQCG